jgi:hypothetical protein
MTRGQTTSEAVLCPLWLEGDRPRAKRCCVPSGWKGTDHERSGALSPLTKLPLPLGEGRGEGTYSARLAAATLTPIPTLSRKRERE